MQFSNMTDLTLRLRKKLGNSDLNMFCFFSFSWKMIHLMINVMFLFWLIRICGWKQKLWAPSVTLISIKMQNIIHNKADYASSKEDQWEHLDWSNCLHFPHLDSSYVCMQHSNSITLTQHTFIEKQSVKYSHKNNSLHDNWNMVYE